MPFKVVAIWFILLIMAVLNGTVREALITPRFGALAGHIISTLMLSAVILVVARVSVSWIGARSASDGVVVGFTWLVLTMAFEFLAGHYLFRRSWEELFADYKVIQGRIWIVVLLATLLGPIWATRSR